MQERRTIIRLKCPIANYPHKIELYFDDEEAAKRCADKFHEYGIEAHLCQPLKRKARRIIG